MYSCAKRQCTIGGLNAFACHRPKVSSTSWVSCSNTGSSYFIPIRVQVKNNQSNAFKWKNNLQICHNKNIRPYLNCSLAKGMSLWRLNIVNMVVITWTYISAVSWLCDVYPHLLGFAQIDAYFSLLRNPAFLKVLFRIPITDIENSLTHRIVIHDHLNSMTLFMLLFFQVHSTVQI